MAASKKEERVKFCLNCDRLIPFDEEICPSCKSFQEPEGKRTCKRCGIALHKDAIYCPGCGQLDVKTTPILDVQSDMRSVKRDATQDREGLHYTLSLSALVVLVLLFWIGFLLDYYLVS